MKKLLALLMCAMMVFSLVACSSSGGSTTDKIETFINDMKSTYASITDSFKDVLDFEVSARDDSIVYTYTYKTDVGDIASIKTYLDGQYDSMKSSMTADLSALRTKVPSAKSLIVEYRNNDKTLITKLEYR